MAADGSAAFQQLYQACKRGTLEVVQAVVNNTPKDHRAAFLSQHNPADWGNTVLHKAAERGHTAIVSYFIQMGVGLDVQNSRNETALWKACWAGKSAAAELLIAKGADIEVKYDNMTPLWAACAFGKPAIAKLLVANKANLETRSKAGKTPVQVTRNRDIAVLLASHGADVIPLLDGHCHLPTSTVDDMVECYLGWLGQHRFETVQDSWRAESAAFACKQRMDPMVQLAVLELDLDVFDGMLLKWSYVLHVCTVVESC